MIYVEDGGVELHLGDARAVLRELPEGSVHCVVTSPPYWGLRSYGTPPVVWGGVPECKHEWVDRPVVRKGSTHGRQDLGSTLVSGASPKTVGPGEGNTLGVTRQYREDGSAYCQRCGAWRGELGQEPTPGEFVEHTVEVFAEVWRVLRDDGTLWLNFGDTYFATSTYRAPRTIHTERGWKETGESRQTPNRGHKIPGLKPKDLVGVPWKVAFALQDAGWWLRAENIWRKLGGMPESVADRPSRNHETIFLLTKGERYFYDRHAVAEPTVLDRAQRRRGEELFIEHSLTDAHLAAIRAVGMNDAGKALVTQDGAGANDPEMQRLADEAKAALGGYYREFLTALLRNKRTVWDMPTANFPDAHYAVFPDELPLTCIRAGTSEKGACSNCGAPHRRVVSERSLDRNELQPDHPEWRPGRYDNGKAGDPQSPGAGQRFVETTTVGWKPNCGCDADVVPCVVLDPFFGAATTGIVARNLGRRCVGIEASEESCALAKRRLERRRHGKPDARPKPVPVGQETLFAEAPL